LQCKMALERFSLRDGIANPPPIALFFDRVLGSNRQCSSVLSSDIGRVGADPNQYFGQEADDAGLL
jgi:hypothetical protein